MMIVLRRDQSRHAARRSDSALIIGEELIKCDYLSSTEHTSAQMIPDRCCLFITQQAELIFTQHLTRWAIPSIKLFEKRAFHSLIGRQLRRAVLAASKM